MPRSIPAFAEPSVLRWARETIGLTEVAAARKISVPDDRVAAWEAGEAQPKIAQLKKAAEVYKRSLAVFFLPDPPNDFDTLRDFRRHQGAQPDEWSPALHEDYRRAHQQRDQALELADLEGYQPPTTWRLDPLPVDDDTLAAAARRAILDAPESLRDLVTTILETRLTIQGNRLNVITKKVTSWAAIIAVPTAITDFYGQNVPYSADAGRAVLGFARSSGARVRPWKLAAATTPSGQLRGGPVAASLGGSADGNPGTHRRTRMDLRPVSTASTDACGRHADFPQSNPRVPGSIPGRPTRPDLACH